jgi:hypothetical protein
MKTLEKLTTLYSPLDIAYSQAMSGPYKDLSYHGEDCDVIAGLKDGKITGFYRPVVAVGDEHSLKLQIVRLYETSRHITYMDFLTDSKLSVISQFLLRQGYRARPYFTQIIDISDMNVVRCNLRKSYKSLVNKTQGVNTTIFERYLLIHSEVCGGVRPDLTWNIQEEMVRTGKAFVVAGPGAAVLIYHNNHIAYYAGGRSLANKNTHALLWYAIETANQLRCKFFEMGEQAFCGSNKERNISHFKAGFGGETKTRLILEPK